MKKEKENETRATSPDRLILKLITSDPIQTGQWIQSQSATTRSPFLWSVYPSGGAGYAKAFVSLQGQGSGFTIGKGPPGLSPGPGEGAGRNPDNKAGPPIGKAQSKNTLQSNKTVLSINKKQNSNFLQTLIFKIMKKQILILVLFVMATFAGVNNSYGQCTPAPLTPAPGVEYDYGVTIAGTGTTPTFLWYVTQDVNLLTGTKLATTDSYFTVGTGSAYNNTTGGTNNIKLTWTPKAVAGVFYLVVKYTEASTAASACIVENIKVFEVKPINTFLLAITGSDATGATVANAQACAPAITGAVVTAATPTVQYTYGVSTLYYKVTASGILGAWRPSIRIPALASDQTYANVEWTNDATGVGGWAAFSGFTAGSSATADLVSTVDATVGDVLGTSYLVRMTINNNNYETLVAQPLALAIDGHLPTAYTVSDIIGSGATPCDPELAFGKSATFTIVERPTVTPAVPATILIPKLPNP